MLQSMTGFGKAICVIHQKNITVEIKSLNSKQLDISSKLPVLFREKEIEIRNELGKQLERGKIDLYINIEYMDSAAGFTINKEVIRQYYQQICEVRDELNIPPEESYMQIIMRLPEVLKSEQEKLNDTNWQIVSGAIQKAVNELCNYRKQEGNVMEKDISFRIQLIMELLQRIEPLEKKRIANIQNRLSQNLNDFISNITMDKNRFEQEILYYLERIDITEEKVRLKNHCDFFLSTLQEKESPGKKLGFISQEMIREINTIGSKAADSDIQKIVVQIKDEVEKIREQINNVL